MSLLELGLAGEATHGCGLRLQPCKADLLGACLAASIHALGEAFQGDVDLPKLGYISVDLGQVHVDHEIREGISSASRTRSEIATYCS